jgi:hypothetical protein
MRYHFPTPGREASMDVSALRSIAVDETPPPLDLTPVAIAALAETLLQYPAEFAPLY